MSRYVVPDIETMDTEVLRRFANGCAALACLPGVIDDAEQRLNTLRARKKTTPHEPDIVFALSILNKPAISAKSLRRDFLRG